MGRCCSIAAHAASDNQNSLAFAVVDQPAMIEEMSPYRHVNAPHLTGYLQTRDTILELRRRAGGVTRLTARASHILRLDPVLYWEPMARWAIRENVTRVLASMKLKAQAIPPLTSPVAAQD